MIKDDSTIDIQGVVGDIYRRWMLDGQGRWDDLLPVEPVILGPGADDICLDRDRMTRLASPPDESVIAPAPVLNPVRIRVGVARVAGPAGSGDPRCWMPDDNLCSRDDSVEWHRFPRQR